MNAKKSTLKNYKFVLTRFENYFGNIELTSITTDGILPFLTKISEGAKQSTKKLRYALISAFFNFIKTSYDSNLQNPCDSPALRQIFKEQKPIHWKIIENEIVDEIIFRTENPRNRLMLELMARGGMTALFERLTANPPHNINNLLLEGSSLGRITDHNNILQKKNSKTS
jgi:hypothetical protein